MATKHRGFHFITDCKEIDRRIFLLDLIFIIRLRDVNKISSLAEIIIDQHDQLDEDDKELLRAILKGKTNHRVMILMDGFDEYSPGTNKDIDKAISSTTGKCYIILTSRPGYLKKHIRDKLNGTIVIEGFSADNVKKCSTLVLGSSELSKQMRQQAEKISIDVILHVPIILLIACLVFRETKSLPKTQTDMFGTVFRLIMDRTTLKRFGCKSSDVPNLEGLLFTLGKFSLQALQNDVQQPVLNKVNIVL